MGQTKHLQQKYESFCEELFSDEKLYNTIKHKMEVEYYSPQMILRYLKTLEIDVPAMKAYTFQRYLKKYGIEYYHEKHLRTSPEFRCKYTKTPKELKEASQLGAKITHNKRRKSAAYTSQHTLNYWLEKTNGDLEEAERSKRHYARLNNPNCIEFWVTKKGLSAEEAKIIISNNSSRAAKVQRRKIRNKRTTTELRVQQILTELGLRFQPEFRVEKECSLGRYYYFDFYLPDYNTLIEVNGTYFHADPDVYSPQDIILETTAKEIWDRDAKKIQRAHALGYYTIVVWEKDLMDMNLVKKALEDNIVTRHKI